MEAQEVCPVDDYRSNVEACRPFRSVKEAVAIFSKSFRAGEIAIPPSPTEAKPPDHDNAVNHRRVTSDAVSDEPVEQQEEEEERGEKRKEKGLIDGLRKLEAELEETKRELRILKEWESETEIALATLNADLHRSMSRLAKVEAMESVSRAKAMSARSSSTLKADFGIREARRIDPGRTVGRERKYYPTLAEILSIADDPKTRRKKGYSGGSGEKEKQHSNKAMKKEKPVIISLVGDLFSWKKENA